jgi:hypothetical protein
MRKDRPAGEIAPLRGPEEAKCKGDIYRQGMIIIHYSWLQGEPLFLYSES